MAMPKALTEEDAAFLRETAERVRQLLGDTANRPRVNAWDEFQPAPELYIARTPSDGLPPMLGAEPGAAECDLYQLLRDDNGVPYVSPLLTQPKLVFNLSSDPVGGNRWALIQRDKFGSWVLGGGGLEPSPTTTDPTPGTGTGTGDSAPLLAGGCGLASIHPDDCIRAYGPLGSVLLSPGGGTVPSWSSSDLLYYDGGAGLAEFWVDGGRVHLSVGGLELLDCGDGCWAGGPLTGHGVPDHRTGTAAAPPCSGRTFRVCLACEPCPVAGTGTGTGSGGGLPAVPAPCQGIDFTSGTLTGVWSNKTGGLTCLTTPATMHGSGTADLILGESSESCEGSSVFTVSCVGGQYVLTFSAGVSAVCVAFSASPFVIVWDIIAAAGTIAPTAGTARLTITWTP